MTRRRRATASFHEDDGLTFEAIVRDPATDARARLTVCDMADDADQARVALAALGLIDYDRLGDL